MSETVERLPPRGMLTLRGDLTALGRVATAVTGLGMPEARRILFDGERAVAWMAPDEVMLMLPVQEVAAALETARAGLTKVPHLLADVSDARVVFRVAGPGAREVLAKGMPVDLAPDRFAEGEIRRSRLGEVAAAVWAREGAIEVMCFRSVADFVEDWLRHAARRGSLPGVLTV
ncbi:MAG: sarcosine oxidase subunit gamma family protein [Pseudomonadota bacterium]